MKPLVLGQIINGDTRDYYNKLQTALEESINTGDKLFEELTVAINKVVELDKSLEEKTNECDLNQQCLEDMDRPLPKPCLKTRFCIMAGGCQECMMVGIKERPYKSMHVVEESI